MFLLEKSVCFSYDYNHDKGLQSFPSDSETQPLPAKAWGSITKTSWAEGSTNETPEGALRSRENGVQNNQGARSRMQK